MLKPNIKIKGKSRKGSRNRPKINFQKSRRQPQPSEAKERDVHTDPEIVEEQEAPVVDGFEDGLESEQALFSDDDEGTDEIIEELLQEEGTDWSEFFEDRFQARNTKIESGHELDPDRYKFKTTIELPSGEEEQTEAVPRLDYQPFDAMEKAVATPIPVVVEPTFDSFDSLIGNSSDELIVALQDYLSSQTAVEEEHQNRFNDGSELGIVHEGFAEYTPEEIGFDPLGSPEELLRKLETVGYICQPFIAAQVSLLINTKVPSIRSVMLEGPSGCGKSFLAKSLAKISGAELMVLQCHEGMNLQALIEAPSQIAMISAMSGKADLDLKEAMHLGIIARAFLASKTKPVILLIDEIDKVETAIDTFFLGPIQDAVVRPEMHPTIHANVDNLLIIFTKNMERPLNDALLRRVQPIEMDYMSTDLEKKVLAPHCAEVLVENLIAIGDIMRNTDGSYPFQRPPAPEELLKTAKYIVHLLRWNITDFGFVGKNIWYMLAKSEHDREVFESLLRFHPDFFDPLVPDGRKATQYQIFSRLGRIVLQGIVPDPDEERRGTAYRPEAVGLTTLGTPENLARKLGDVGYQCLPFIATQLSLLMNTPSGRVRGLLLEGPSGCGKSFLAKCLAQISGAHFMCMSCFEGMETKYLLEYPSELATARAKAGEKLQKKDLMLLGVLSRAFLKSQSQPTILLVDEIDKVGDHVDTFFLGPLQDGRIWLESRPPVDANIDNLLIVFTKNENRVLDQALLRRLHPIRMTYLDSTLERKILGKHCVPQLVANLVSVADRMRDSRGSFQFERPPAPEELLTAGHYISKMLEWLVNDFTEIGKNVWSILSKSEHDRAVLEHMLRFHPDFEDPLFPDGKNTPLDEIYARLGRWVLRGIVEDPDAERREAAWATMTWD